MLHGIAVHIKKDIKVGDIEFNESSCTDKWLGLQSNYEIYKYVCNDVSWGKLYAELLGN